MQQSVEHATAPQKVQVGAYDTPSFLWSKFTTSQEFRMNWRKLTQKLSVSRNNVEQNGTSLDLHVEMDFSSKFLQLKRKFPNKKRCQTGATCASRLQSDFAAHFVTSWDSLSLSFTHSVLLDHLLSSTDLGFTL